MNKVSFLHVGVGWAVKTIEEWFGEGTEQARALAGQACSAAIRRMMIMNGRSVLLAGVHATPGGAYEGWMLVNPDWKAPPIGLIRIVRALREHCAPLAPLHVYVRSEAGRRLAICCGLSLARTLRLNGEILEVWHVVAEKDVPRDYGCAIAAQAGGVAGGVTGGASGRRLARAGGEPATG